MLSTIANGVSAIAALAAAALWWRASTISVPPEPNPNVPNLYVPVNGTAMNFFATPVKSSKLNAQAASAAAVVDLPRFRGALSVWDQTI